MLKSECAGHLRPLNMQRDLMVVADLVELCFADTLDSDGRRYVRQMRDQARSFHRPVLSSSRSAALGGFVWEEHGRIVGNLNLIPITVQHQKAYLIANVAVHPQHRRQGIARSMTLAALEEIKREKVYQIWLQVNVKNPAAIALYESTGFQEQLRRTTWHSSHGRTQEKLPAGLRITARHWGDWPMQRQWLREIYPSEVRWHLPINMNLLSSGMAGTFNRLLDDRRLRQWSARADGELIGVITWQSSSLQADWLWLAPAPEYEEMALQTLLSFTRQTLSMTRTLAVNYPSGRFPDAFNKAGFEGHETLIWMRRQVGYDQQSGRIETNN